MPHDKRLSIKLKKLELDKWVLKEAEHWNEYLHAQRNIHRLEGEISRLKNEEEK